MAKKKIIRQLFLPFIFVIVFPLIAIGWYSFNTLESFYLEETENNLYAKAMLFKPMVISSMNSGTESAALLQDLITKLDKKTGTRITIMIPDGTIIADSQEEPNIMDNHASRSEMRNALIGEIGASIRYSNTLQISMMYLAVPLKDNDQLKGVLRLSVSIASIDNTLNGLLIKIFSMVFIIFILAAVLTVYISRKVSRPLEELTHGAENFARGDFDHKLPEPDSEEIARLARAMNIMADGLDERINTITRQNNEQQAILQSMIEGVIAIDLSENIININNAALDLLGLSQTETIGKSIQETIRNSSLQNIIAKTLKKNKSYEGEITLQLNRERFISYSSSVLKGASGQSIGVLLVLNDLTNIRRLEKIRSDFVANVSHELRTPITSIKGFVETLSHGAINNQEDANRFLEIITRQVDRLNAIIEDLLHLSQIEQDAENEDINFEETNIYQMLNFAADICRHKADEKNISFKIDIDKELTASINAHLMEQAVTNLLSNAIKFSSDGSQVIISGNVENQTLHISVTDFGTGIEKKHLERLFERFYRVDKARSREIGGTGLGLAIVKHIALSHKGAVTVESEPGKGSTFSIKLPL